MADSRFFSTGEAFTFLYMTIGPVPIIGAFADMTAGCGARDRRKLALWGIGIAALIVLTAGTTGIKTLQAWGISTGALLSAGGLILLLVALNAILRPHRMSEAPARPASDAASLRALAFSPLAFPTIIPPYGIATVILLATLAVRRAGDLQVLIIITLFVLLLDLIAMLLAPVLVRLPGAVASAEISAKVIGVLQVALSAQAIVDGLRLMGVVG